MMDVDNKGLMKEKQMRLLVPVTDQPAVLTEAQSRELEVALAELMLSAVHQFLKADEGRQ
jgi:hypothetical protein